jgi:hypothetical protein
MADPNTEHELIRVKGPALPPVTLRSGTTFPTSASELIRVSGPALPVVRLRSERVEPVATVVLRVPLAPGADVEGTFKRLRSLVAKVNEVEVLLDRAGVWVDGNRSGVQNGEVVIVLAPNDETDALDTCKRVSRILFDALNNAAGVTVRVFAANEPETPVYELAA